MNAIAKSINTILNRVPCIASKRFKLAGSVIIALFKALSMGSKNK
jgi:hypothetical protein